MYFKTQTTTVFTFKNISVIFVYKCLYHCKIPTGHSMYFNCNYDNNVILAQKGCQCSSRRFKATVRDGMFRKELVLMEFNSHEILNWYEKYYSS